jgi:23S rRNA (cytosine1962-C5)-methyltransferase
MKLERFGKYVFARPEVAGDVESFARFAEWREADAVFIPSGEESGGHWDFKKKVEEKWEMGYALTPPLP